jgi:hypothetical protein
MSSIAKRGTLIILFTILLSFSVSAAANFSAQDGYDWLAKQSASDGSFDGSTYKTALAIMALDQAGYDTTLSENWVYSQLDEKNCFPFGACTVTDTAAAALAFNEVQDDSHFDLLDAWFLDTLEDADVGGSWSLEVITSSSGMCTISYNLNNELKEVEVEVNAGKFPSCGNSNFLDLDECVQKNLITTTPGILIDVDCSTLEGNVVLALVYQSGSTYYLVGNENSKTTEFQVNNGCYGKTTSSACNIDAALWAGWALDKLGSKVNTLLYLKEGYDSSDTVHNAFMYLITKDIAYVDTLTTLQKADGSFDRDTFATGIALVALSEAGGYDDNIINGQSFLREEQSSDGHWGSDIEATAMALFGGFGTENVAAATCFDGKKNGAEEGSDCGGPCKACTASDYQPECESDSYCLTQYGSAYTCSSGNCIVTSEGCSTDEECDYGQVCIDGSCIVGDCDHKGTCDYPEWDETAVNCPDDCFCGDSVCDSTETVGSCAEDCTGDDTPTPVTPTTQTKTDDKGSNSGTIIMIILLLLLIGVGIGGYFAYKKGYLDEIIAKFKKKPKGPQPGAPTTPGGYQPFSNKVPPQKPLPGQQPKNPFAR